MTCAEFKGIVFQLAGLLKLTYSDVPCCKPECAEKIMEDNCRNATISRENNMYTLSSCIIFLDLDVVNSATWSQLKHDDLSTHDISVSFASALLCPWPPKPRPNEIWRCFWVIQAAPTETALYLSEGRNFCRGFCSNMPSTLCIASNLFLILRCVQNVLSVITIAT